MKEGTTIIGQSIKRGEKNKIYHVYHANFWKRDKFKVSHIKALTLIYHIYHVLYIKNKIYI